MRPVVSGCEALLQADTVHFVLPDGSRWCEAIGYYTKGYWKKQASRTKSISLSRSGATSNHWGGNLRTSPSLLRGQLSVSAQRRTFVRLLRTAPASSSELAPAIFELSLMSLTLAKSNPQRFLFNSNLLYGIIFLLSDRRPLCQAPLCHHFWRQREGIFWKRSPTFQA